MRGDDILTVADCFRQRRCANINRNRTRANTTAGDAKLICSRHILTLTVRAVCLANSFLVASRHLPCFLFFRLFAYPVVDGGGGRHAVINESGY